jgi:hypothetical protein
MFPFICMRLSCKESKEKWGESEEKREGIGENRKLRKNRLRT